MVINPKIIIMILVYCEMF